MATKTPMMPLYPSSEYMLVLSPDEHLQERIGKIKQTIIQTVSEKTGTRPAGGKSNILLARWQAWDMQEDRLLRHLQVLSMEQYPFQVHLENFNGFPSHTIYIPVTSREPILRLIARVRQHKRMMQSAGKDPYFANEPVMTLARGLTSLQYEQAMSFLEPRHFRASFVADAMLLLKKRAGAQAYQILQRFSFEHLAVTARQGALFA
jgi:2'-5' RNA ligase